MKLNTVKSECVLLLSGVCRRQQLSPLCSERHTDTYLEEGEGVGHLELHLLSVHSRRMVLVELHQVLGLIDGAQLYKRLQDSQHVGPFHFTAPVSISNLRLTTTLFLLELKQDFISKVQ